MKHRTSRLMALALLAAASLSACRARPPAMSPTDQPTASPSVGPAKEGTMTPESSSTPQEGKLLPGSEVVVQLAKEDLAQRLDLSSDVIEVVSLEEVDWPDTSLGCPKPAMMYAQVITPGYCVVLGAEEQIYEYHTGGGQVVLCADGGQPYITLWPTVLPDEHDAEFDPEKLMEVERLIREKESLGYDVRAARVYLATAQWMDLQEKPAQANAYLDLALEALEEAQEAGKIPSEELRGTAVPRKTFIPEPESKEGD